MCSCLYTMYVHEASMNPTLNNGSSAMWCFEHDSFGICDGIIDFYMKLLHTCIWTYLRMNMPLPAWSSHKWICSYLPGRPTNEYALTCLVVPQMPWCWGQWGCLSLGTAAPSLHCSACGWEDGYTIQEKPLWVAECICSVQSDNLCNLETALHILRILRLSRQSEDCITRVCNLEVAQL